MCSPHSWGLFFFVSLRCEISRYLCDMDFNEEYFAARSAAVAWLKVDQRRRDYKKGVELLDKINFKPALCRRLKMTAENYYTRRLLAMTLTDAINFYRYPNDPKFNDDTIPAELEVEDSGTHQDVASEAAVAEEGEKVAEVRVDSAAAASYPSTVQRVYKWFAKDYKLRDKLHREMRGIGEKNDDLSMARRKELSDKISLLSDEMDALYKLRENYHANGTIPTQDDLDAVKFVKLETSSAQTKTKVESSSLHIKEEDFSSMGREELMRRIHSLQTSITRKKNMLLYQSPSREKKENPMPDCPKRTKLETQIRLIDDKLFAARNALAKLG